MTWLIIILVLALLIGPMMYLVPNAKDRRLTALRSMARRLGLTVQITSVARLDPTDNERVTAGAKEKHPKIACAAYQLPVTQRLTNFEPIMLIKIPDSPTVALTEALPGWALDDATARRAWIHYEADHGGMDALREVLLELPHDCLGLGLDKRFVSCYWLEKAEPEARVVERIYELLAGLREDLYRRFGASGDA